MDAQQQLAMDLGKRLVPLELRPAYAQETWGSPFLTTSQFVTGLGTMTFSIISGVFLYYSVRFISYNEVIT